MDPIDALLSEPDLPPPGVRAALRKAARPRMSQEAAAKAIGVTRVAFARWEYGEAEPNPEHRPAYLRLLTGLARKHPKIWRLKEAS